MNRTNHLVAWLIAIACVAIVAAAHTLTGESPDLVERHVALGTVGQVDESRWLSVTKLRVGEVWYSGDRIQARTDAIFLVLDVTIENTRFARGQWHTEGRSASGRSFLPVSDLDMPDAGYRQDTAVVFELSPEDLAGFEVLFYSREVAYALDDELVVDLGLTPDAAAALAAEHGHDVVKVETQAEEAIG